MKNFNNSVKNSLIHKKLNKVCIYIFFQELILECSVSGIGIKIEVDTYT